MELTSGYLLPSAVDLIVHRKLDLINERLMLALFHSPKLRVAVPQTLPDLEPALISKTVAVAGRRFMGGVFFCDPASFDPFVEGIADYVALYRADREPGRGPVISLHSGVRARGSAGPVSVSWPDGVFSLCHPAPARLHGT